MRVANGKAAQVGGGLPDAIADIPYQLLNVGDAVLAGLVNGDVWRSEDGGDHWTRLPVNLGCIERSLTAA